MFKRVTIVALLVAAFLVLAVPALAFNGYRADYTTSDACAICHSGIAGIPATYGDWAETGHARAGHEDQALRLPYGSVCQGCHTANFAPAKVVPTPTATSAAGVVSWGAGNGYATQAQALGNAAASENFVGCSSCHYGANVGGGGLDRFGVDPNDTAHRAPISLMANADICGQCHSRFSYTTQTFAVEPIPTPTAVATTLIQPQMALGGYRMVGEPASPPPGWDPAASLTDYLTVPRPGWTPTPTATTPGLGSLQTYWKIDGEDSVWQQSGHDGAAQQYPEWAGEGHARALTGLTGQAFWPYLDEPTKQSCLECHSTDFVLLKEAGKSPTSADAKYGVTCVGCHAPHSASGEHATWNGHADPQLRVSAKKLCITCHTAGLAVGAAASPGEELSGPAKEMIAGYGAVDVPGSPSVHKGKCVECHMVPTSTGYPGEVQMGANHTFKVVTPADATNASPMPMVTTRATATATPVPGGTPVVTTTVTVTRDGMPFSGCSTCHSKAGPAQAKPVPVSTVRATPNPTASPLAVTVTITQDANGTPVAGMAGGDKALWLQDTIDQRQEWTRARIEEIWTTLDAAATNLGYADRAAARTAIMAKPAKAWTTAERAFLSAWTNATFVENEGSLGLHNWRYSSDIANKAVEQAKVARTGVAVRKPWKVTFNVSRTSAKLGQKVKLSGTVKTATGVAGAGQVSIMRLIQGTGQWKVWLRVKLNAKGAFARTVQARPKGSWRLKAVMPADALNLTGTSTPVRTLTVK